jgi:hypothetical protein
MKINRQFGESPTSAAIGSASYVSYTACTSRGRFSLDTVTMPCRKKEDMQVIYWYCINCINLVSDIKGGT